MDFRCQINHALDGEHRATLDLLARVEQAFLRTPAPADFGRLISALARHVDLDLGRHFDFEERELFPRLEQSGAGDLVGLLLEDHRTIRDVAAGLLPLARAMATRALEASEQKALKREALGLVERLRAHIDKETVALLPELDGLLDEQTDRELALVYAEA